MTQRLGVIRRLFDWLATGQAVPVSPAARAAGGDAVGEGGTTHASASAK